jgi:hypothetical protein
MGLPSIGTFLGGIGALLGKASTYIPGRVEKLKNEKARLEKERNDIEKINLDIDNPDHVKKAMRLSVIIDRITAIDGLLGTHAQD